MLGRSTPWDQSPAYVEELQKMLADSRVVDQSAIASATPSLAPATTAPHNQQVFDTLGQVIFKSLGHCALPLRILWMQSVPQPIDPEVGNVLEGNTEAGVYVSGIVAGTEATVPVLEGVGEIIAGANGYIVMQADGSFIYTYTTGAGGDIFTYSVYFPVEEGYGTTVLYIPAPSPPVTSNYAAAMCSPIDPYEQGYVSSIMLRSQTIYQKDIGMILPTDMDEILATLLTFSITNALIYPGDEFQDPCPLIAADRGAGVTNGFRGLRYILFPTFPVAIGVEGLSIVWVRTNALGG